MRNKPTTTKVNSTTDDAAAEALGVVPMAAAGTTLVTGGAPGGPAENPDLPLVSDSPVIATAVSRREESDVPMPPRFRVTQGGSVMYAGARVQVRVGKELDSRSFDLDVLRSQGIKLEPLE